MSTRAAACRGLLALSLGLTVGCSGAKTGTASSTPSTAADQQAITTLINSPQLQPFLPNGITSDGGVVFATQSGLQASGFSVQDQPSGKQKAQPISRFGRAVTSQQPLQVAIQFAPSRLAATATVTSVESGDMAYALAGDDGKPLHHKQFQEQHVRLLQFVKAGGAWTFAGLSPIVTHPVSPSLADVQLAKLVLSVNGAVVQTYTSPNQLQDLGQLPVLHAGDVVKIEVTASAPDTEFDTPLLLYMHGLNAGDRLQLLDDGGQTALPGPQGQNATSGDAGAGDGVYTRTYSVTSAKGIYHLTVDGFASSAADDDDRSDYQSAAFTITVAVS